MAKNHFRQLLIMTGLQTGKIKYTIILQAYIEAHIQTNKMHTATHSETSRPQTMEEKDTSETLAVPSAVF